MAFRTMLVFKQLLRTLGISAFLYFGFSTLTPFPVSASDPQAPAPSPAQSSSPARLGTIKFISGNTITLTTDSGSEVTILVQDAAKLLRIAPGQKDLKDATSISLTDLQTGDRILVRGALAPDGKSVLASSVIAMKKADIADKQAREREEWQRHGIGGVVSVVDPATNTITVALPAIGEKKSVAIHLSKDTVLRRYAPDSIKFDDAKLAPLDQIKPGDQLRARGARTPDGSELTAVEVVSGTFRNIAGTISFLDVSANTLTVQDLATKKPVTLKITSDSQVRKLPPPMAQRIAARLKGLPADSSASTAATSANANGTPPARPASTPGAAASSNAQSSGPGGVGAGAGRPGSGGPPDLQQAISRMPASTLADLQKGAAVKIVSTEGGPNGLPTAITLLAGVEPILEASPNATILSPWSLGGGPGGEATAQ